jgi:hypothetical protein
VLVDDGGGRSTVATGAAREPHAAAITATKIPRTP